MFLWHSSYYWEHSLIFLGLKKTAFLSIFIIQIIMNSGKSARSNDAGPRIGGPQHKSHISLRPVSGCKLEGIM